jgi:5-methylcytosine-specific restriction protein B
MATYFTSDHFKLLNKWQGQMRDESIPEQNRAYEELKQAYEVTEAWAKALQARLFPTGVVEVRKRPTSQANAFLSYNWARIYPSTDSPKKLAYTVGIAADAGFVVKIDTVQADPDLKSRYEKIRGPFGNTSPIVATLSSSDGLSKSLNDLVEWSAEAIKAFKLKYDDVALQLELAKPLSDEDLLLHFDGKPAFKTFRASWSPEQKNQFCRIARAVHAAGLDWWHATKNVQLRFGRKNPGTERAAGVLGIVRGMGVRKISWNKGLGSLGALHREPITDELVAQIEEELRKGHDVVDGWWPQDSERPGLWPDQLRDDQDDTEGSDLDDEQEDTEVVISRQPINRIYYGPPGTGKTYELTKLLKREYEQSTRAISVDAWRQQFINDKIAGLKWWHGIFLALHVLKGKATVSQLMEHPFIKAIGDAKGRKENIRATLWATLQERTVDESTTVKQKNRFSPQVFDKGSNSEWRLAGDWKDECADLIALSDEFQRGDRPSETLKRYSFVTFHQSYGYEEFVEGLRPVMSEEEVTGDIKYEIRSGVFKELCRKARAMPDQRFAMVIDEINRGNISKIFGELITLIEADKREGCDNAVSVVLPFSGKPFAVPQNVDIIGTMNTADRSLALLDTALRRRFDFVPLLPDSRDEIGAPLSGLRVTLGEQVIEIPRLLTAMNQRIEALFDKDHCIGHAYFTPLAHVPDGDERMVALQQVFSNRILPLLEEYFFEDWQKIRLVLADNQKPESARFVIEVSEPEQDLVRLFGDDHGLDAYGTKRRFSVQDSAFSSPEAYVLIYTTLDH